MTAADFQKMALDLPAVAAAPHFERTAFRVGKNPIFASLHEPTASANIALPPDEQAAFCELAAGAAEPLENAFGRKGWTNFDLKKAAPEVILAALETAHGWSLRGKKGG